jgi:hypothetical protein
MKRKKKNFIFFAFQWCFFIKPPLLRLWFSLQLLIEVEAKSQTLLYYSFVFELHSIHFNCFLRMRLLWPLGKPIPNGGNPSSVHTISPGSTLNQWKACFLIGLKRNVLSGVWVGLKPSYCKGRSSQNQAKSEALLAQTTSTRITFDQNLIMIWNHTIVMWKAFPH